MCTLLGGSKVIISLQQKSTDTQPSTFASNADAAINTADSDAENETQVMDHNEKTLLLSDNEETSNTHT